MRESVVYDFADSYDIDFQRKMGMMKGAPVRADVNKVWMQKRTRSHLHRTRKVLQRTREQAMTRMMRMTAMMRMTRREPRGDKLKVIQKMTAMMIVARVEARKLMKNQQWQL